MFHQRFIIGITFQKQIQDTIVLSLVAFVIIAFLVNWLRKELIGEEDVFCHAGEQRLYAQWDESPVIEAKDQYYSLTDARSGRITEEILLQQACAKDRKILHQWLFYTPLRQTFLLDND